MEITRVGPFLEYLDRLHARTRRIVTCVTEDDLEWQAGPGRMTPGDIIRHLAGIERYMYAENAHGRPARYPGHSRDLADGLEATVAYYDRLHAGGDPVPRGTRIETPTAHIAFPREIVRPTRSRAERYYNIQRWSPMPAGGHFAALEQPQALVEDVRAFFRDYRR